MGVHREKNRREEGSGNESVSKRGQQAEVGRGRNATRLAWSFSFSHL